MMNSTNTYMAALWATHRRLSEDRAALPVSTPMAAEINRIDEQIFAIEKQIANRVAKSIEDLIVQVRLNLFFSEISSPHYTDDTETETVDVLLARNMAAAVKRLWPSEAAKVVE